MIFSYFNAQNKNLVNAGTLRHGLQFPKHQEYKYKGVKETTLIIRR